MNEHKDTATPAAPQVWASFDCEGESSLTRGKMYSVIADHGISFETESDDGEWMYCSWENSARLYGGNWTRHTSPDATQAGKPIGPADWARIRACLAACEGIPTEALEAGVVSDMLEALRALLSADLYANGEGIVSFDFPDTEEGEAAAKLARAAIAKVEGKG